MMRHDQTTRRVTRPPAKATRDPDVGAAPDVGSAPRVWPFTLDDAVTLPGEDDARRMERLAETYRRVERVMRAVSAHFGRSGRQMCDHHATKEDLHARVFLVYLLGPGQRDARAAWEKGIPDGHVGLLPCDIMAFTGLKKAAMRTAFATLDGLMVARDPGFREVVRALRADIARGEGRARRTLLAARTSDARPGVPTVDRPRAATHAACASRVVRRHEPVAVCVEPRVSADRPPSLGAGEQLGLGWDDTDATGASSRVSHGRSRVHARRTRTRDPVIDAACRTVGVQLTLWSAGGGIP